MLVVGELIFGLDLAGKQSASEGVVDDDVDSVSVTCGDSLDIEVSG